MARFILEGEWSGYPGQNQRRIVHREVVDAKRAERLRKVYRIVYTDGTALYLRLREAKPREKVEVRNSYGSLIREAEAAGKDTFRIGVDDVPQKAA